MDTELVLFIIIPAISVYFGVLTEILAKSKGINSGFWYGFFFWIIGFILVICMKDKTLNNSNNFENVEQEKSITETFKEKIVELEKLHELKVKGVISESLFDFNKSEILHFMILNSKIIVTSYDNDDTNFEIQINGKRKSNFTRKAEMHVHPGDNKVVIGTYYYDSNSINININKFETTYFKFKCGLTSVKLYVQRVKSDSQVLIYEMLDRLNELKIEHILTEEEFNAIKATWLN